MLFVLCLTAALSVVFCDKPNIILIVADDLGWNDVGFHGLADIPTPNIDALAASGIFLQNHYVTPICTPSRAALMTGKYPIHTGMQHGVIYGAQRGGLPLEEKILPQYLKELDYRTHLVGKWHLGHYRRQYLPMHRGFDSHVGFWTGKIDMYDHTNMEKNMWGFDFRRGYMTAFDLFGQYATDIYTNEAVKLIQEHDTSKPMFLMVAHSAVHSGNPNEPIRAPDSIIDRFGNITGRQRQKFAGVLTKLDESVGKVVAALRRRDMLHNSVILFTTDNGGVPEGFNDNAGSNYPLRGTKNTLWEGGVRGSAFVWSPLLQKRSRVATQTLHLVDWLPTLLRVAGGDVSSLHGIDGVDQWEALSSDTASARKTVLHNIDDIEKIAAITVDQWKLVQGTTYKGQWDNWYGPSGYDAAYDIEAVYSSPAGGAMTEMGHMPNREVFRELREAAIVKCGNATPIACSPLTAPCLFNVAEDPCERRNVADMHQDIVAQLLTELSKLNSTVVGPTDRPLDQNGNPRYWGHTYVNFGDFDTPINYLQA